MTSCVFFLLEIEPHVFYRLKCVNTHLSLLKGIIPSRRVLYDPSTPSFGYKLFGSFYTLPIYSLMELYSYTYWMTEKIESETLLTLPDPRLWSRFRPFSRSQTNKRIKLNLKTTEKNGPLYTQLSFPFSVIF